MQLTVSITSEKVARFCDLLHAVYPAYMELPQ